MDILDKLSKSKFRSSFHLNKQMIEYVNEKGMTVIREHAYDLITKRLKPKFIENDGKQTPMNGHPVFIAQHACACCCRSCLFKWHKFPKGYELSDMQVEYIVNILMKWIEKEINEKIK